MKLKYKDRRRKFSYIHNLKFFYKNRSLNNILKKNSKYFYINKNNNKIISSKIKFLKSIFKKKSNKYRFKFNSNFLIELFLNEYVYPTTNDKIHDNEDNSLDLNFDLNNDLSYSNIDDYLFFKKNTEIQDNKIFENTSLIKSLNCNDSFILFDKSDDDILSNIDNSFFNFETFYNKFYDNYLEEDSLVYSNSLIFDFFFKKKNFNNTDYTLYNELKENRGFINGLFLEYNKISKYNKIMFRSKKFSFLNDIANGVISIDNFEDQNSAICNSSSSD
jgi:hypothetical protein